MGVAAGVVLSAAPAMAGFQFTAPVQDVNQTQQTPPPLSSGLLPPLPDLSPEPAMQVQPMPTPFPQDSVAGPTPLAVPQPQQQTIQQTPRQPANTGISSLAPTNATMTPAQPTQNMAPMSQDYALAVGFGSNLPLVTALEQVVPDDYTYVMTDSAPMSTPVSWEGGRPWNMVLDDMLSPLGMRADISGKTVSLVKASRNKPVTTMASNTPTPTQPINQPMAQAAVQTTGEPQPLSNFGQPLTPMAEQAAQPRVQPVAMTVEPQVTKPVFSAPRQQPISRTIPTTTRGTWTSEKGATLRSVLEVWSAQAGAELFWSSDYDFPLAGAVNISGSFEDAVETLLKGFEEATPKPIARLHPNLPHGPAVLVVETRQVLD